MSRIKVDSIMRVFLFLVVLSLVFTSFPSTIFAQTPLTDNGNHTTQPLPSPSGRTGWNNWRCVNPACNEDLLNIAMLNPEVGWAIGEYGTIVHWDGTSWESVQSPSHAAYLNRIAIINENDVWVFSNHDLEPAVHWNGSTWSLIESSFQELYDVDFVASDDGWATLGGYFSTPRVLHYDGTAWTPVDWPAELHPSHIDMVSADDGWLVASNGSQREFYHYDGTTWSPTGDIAPMLINELVMEDATGGWAIGTRSNPRESIVLRFSDGHWTEVRRTSGDLYNDIAVAGGHVWVLIEVPSTPAHDAVDHFDGVSWTRTDLPADKSFIQLNAIAATGLTGAWVVGNRGSILRLDGTDWSAVHGYNLCTYDYNTLFSSRPAGTWLGGTVNSGPYSAPSACYNTASWRLGPGGWTPVEGPTPPGFYSIAMLDATDGWAIGNANNRRNYMLRFDGTRWQPFLDLTNHEIRSIAMASKTDGWAVGGSSLMYHFDGTAWNPISNPTNMTLYAVGAAGPHDYWAVGGAGVVLHYDGTAWQAVDYGGYTGALYGLSILAPNNIWLVGGNNHNGAVLHYDGTSWEQTSIEGRKLKVITMLPDGTGWAADAYAEEYEEPGAGHVLHYYNGSTWSEVEINAKRPIYDIAMIDGNHGWAAGPYGTLLEFRFEPERPFHVFLPAIEVGE